MANMNRVSLWEDVRTGLYYGAGFTVIATLIVVVAVASDAVGAREYRDLNVILPFGLPLVILGYFAAGTVGGCAFWVLRLLGNSLVGWMVRGFVIAALVYGVIGVTGIIGFSSVGLNLLDLESASEGWRMLPVIAGITGVFPGTLVGAYYWYQQRHE